MSSAGKVDGSGYGGTDWATRDLVQIWQAVANQDTGTHYELLTGWRRSYELVLQHLAQVENYRANLAIAWPPEKSVAAAAYLDRLDSLIAYLRDTYSAAVRNYSALSAATGALGQARVSVQAIYREYAANSVALAEYGSQRPPVGKVPVIRAAPPVADGRQEELTRQARAIMYRLSNELNQARTSIVTPMPFSSSVMRSEEGTERQDSTDSSASPFAGEEPSRTPQYGPGEQKSPSDDASRNSNIRVSGIRPTHDSLASIALATVEGSFSRATRKSSAVTSPTPVLAPNGENSQVELGPASSASVVGMQTGAASTPADNRRRIPVDGVIGSQATARRDLETETRPSRTANPVGGIIGGPGSRDTAAQQRRTPAAQQQVDGVVGQPRRLRGREDLAVQACADNRWEIAYGVAPVVLPACEQRVEPGPVIGLQ